MKSNVLRIALITLILLAASVAILAVRQARAVAQIHREWEAPPSQNIPALETTRLLEILPLYEEAGDGGRFQVGHGVAYLIKTDGATILMDVGNDAGKSNPSPLAHNMNALGVAWEDIDVVVISHPHPDHVGGLNAWRERTLALGDAPVDLRGKPIYTPIPFRYAGAETGVAADPTLIAPGVATIGAIPYPEVFPLSLLIPRGVEQSIVAHVAGKGLVLITGCGHPTLERLVTRAEAVFELPVVGVVGGLHYQGSEAAALEPHVAFLQARDPVLVALSTHDSGAAAIQAFRSAFPDVYQDVQVGQTILLAD